MLGEAEAKVIIFLCFFGILEGGLISAFILEMAKEEHISREQALIAIKITYLIIIQVFLLIWLGNSFIGWLPTILVVSWIFLDFIFKNIRELITLGRISLLDRRINRKNLK